MPLDRVQNHAAKFSSMPCTITHATKSFATETPCPFFKMLRLLLEMLFHVLQMMAIEYQKFISYTSDLTSAKAISDGEPFTPSLLVTALPSINDLFAGDSRAHDLLRAQPATSQHIQCELVDLDDLLLQAQPVTMQCTLCKLVDLDKLDIGNDKVYKLGIRPMTPYPNIAMCYKFHIGSTMPCPRLAMCYVLCIMPTTSCLTLVTRSLLAHQYNPFSEVYMGDDAELFPARIGDHDSKQSCILPVTQDITKCNTSGESITMDLKTFARVSLICPFGRHMPVHPTGLRLSIVYGCHQLAKHTVLAGFQFNPGGYLSQGFVFDPGGFTFDLRGFMQLLKFLQAAHDVMINDWEQSVKYFLHNASDIHVVNASGHSGQCCFRQKGSDKNHTGLSPCDLWFCPHF